MFIKYSNIYRSSTTYITLLRKDKFKIKWFDYFPSSVVMKCTENVRIQNVLGAIILLVWSVNWLFDWWKCNTRYQFSSASRLCVPTPGEIPGEVFVGDEPLNDPNMMRIQEENDDNNLQEGDHD